MAVKIRLARGGRKNHPHYKIIVANSCAPRDGRFIEKVGFYNPLLPNTHAQHIDLKNDRIEYWLQQGAQPTDRVIRFLIKAGIVLPSKLSAKVAIKLKNRKPKPPRSKEKA